MEIQKSGKERLGFFYCPNHCERIKWHPRPAPDFRTCKKWLKEKDGALAAAIVDDQGLAITNLTNATASANSSDISSILASAIYLAAGKKEVTAYISDSLDAIHNL